MPIVVFGNNSSPHDNGNKIDTSLFVKKPTNNLRTIYIEGNIEEYINMKNKKKSKIYFVLKKSQIKFLNLM